MQSCNLCVVTSHKNITAHHFFAHHFDNICFVVRALRTGSLDYRSTGSDASSVVTMTVICCAVILHFGLRLVGR